MERQATLEHVQQTVYSILIAISYVHLANDLLQNTIVAIFPILRESLALSFAQIGLIAFTMNVTASILQPLIGLYTDRRPLPQILPIGILFSLVGLVGLAWAKSFPWVLASVAIMGVGSSVLHPESSRVAYLAAGPRRGMAQSIFQTGGNLGGAIAPALTALIVVPRGQGGVLWFAVFTVAALAVQISVARWYREQLPLRQIDKQRVPSKDVSKKADKIGWYLTILVLLIFSKTIYGAAMTQFYPFYLMQFYGVSVERAQWQLFILLGAGVLGTFLGGPLADRFGRRNMIWLSILGAAPFAILLPFVNLFWSTVLSVLIGLIIYSSFSVIVVYAQELLPGKVGAVSGLFFGLAFGLGGIGSILLGTLADSMGIETVILVSAFLPLIGLLTAFLPSDRRS